MKKTKTNDDWIKKSIAKANDLLTARQKDYEQASLMLERIYNKLIQQPTASLNTLDINISDIEKKLFDASYRAIWASYAKNKFELQQHFAEIAVRLGEKWGEPLQQAKANNGLAIALYKLGKPSIEYNLRAKELFDETFDKLENFSEQKKLFKSIIKNYFGVVINLGFSDKLNQAENIVIELIKKSVNLKLDYEEALCHKIYGELLQYYNKKNESYREFNKSIEILKKHKTKSAYNSQLFEVLVQVGLNAYNNGDKDIAKEYYSSAKTNQIENEYEFYKYYFLSFLLTEKEYEKLENLKNAISILNKIRWEIKIVSNIDSFLKHREKEKIYLNYIDLSLKTGNISQAFNLLEDFKSKLFIENVLESKKSNIKGVSSNLVQEREKIIKQIEKYEKKYKSTYKTEDYDYIKEMKEKLYENDEKIFALKSYYRTFSEEKKENVIQLLTDKLKQGETVLEYFYYKNVLYFFVIKQSTVIEKIEINISKFEKLLNDFILLLKKTKNSGSNKIVEYYVSELQNVLIKPIEKYLKDTTKLIVVPYRILHCIPFALIFEEYLEYLEFSILPNSYAVNILSGTKSNFEDILLIGNPDTNLHNVEEEISVIKNYYQKSKVLFKDDATKENILNEIVNYRSVHFSGHIYYNKEYPLYTYFKCYETENSSYTEADKLQLKNIYDLPDTNLEFVCLSGCSSGLSTLYSGDELVGLVNGFFYAGAKSIIATLWDIEDESAKTFMTQFYKLLKESNGNRKQAFAKTYLKMKASGYSPFYYSPYIIYEGL